MGSLTVMSSARNKTSWGRQIFLTAVVLAPFHAQANWFEAGSVNVVPVCIYSLHSKSRCSGAFRKVSADAH